MANSIIAIKHIGGSTSANFTEAVTRTIKDLQDNGLCVEIQYQATVITDEVPSVVYSALLIGRAQSVR